MALTCGFANWCENCRYYSAYGEVITDDPYTSEPGGEECYLGLLNEDDDGEM